MSTSAVIDTMPVTASLDDLAPVGPPTLPPGPKLPTALSTYLFWQQMPRVLPRYQQRYGDVFSMSVMPFGKVVMLADPELIKQVVTGPPDVFKAGASNGRFLAPVLGKRGVLVLDEDEHLDTRKLLLPAFHGDAIRAYEQVIRDVTEQRIAHWQVGEQVSMHDESRAITIEIILRAVFGAGDSRTLPELRKALGEVTHIPFTTSLMFLYPQLRAIPPWRTYAASLKRANELIDQLIDERRLATDLDERTDILSLLVRAGAEDRVWLRDQVMNLLAAGHETTTTGLAWAVELLAHHPEARARAREGDDAYLDAIVNETLRLRTVLPGITRYLARDAIVGPYHLPAKTTILGGSLLLHRDPRIYEEPDAFRPERFLEERPGTYTWFPFGGGRRRCIGAAFAQLEMRLALRTMLDNLDWEPVGPPERPRNFHISLIPTNGAQITRTR
jgi:cytochrome P450 family 135